MSSLINDILKSENVEIRGEIALLTFAVPFVLLAPFKNSVLKTALVPLDSFQVCQIIYSLHSLTSNAHGRDIKITNKEKGRLPVVETGFRPFLPVVSNGFITCSQSDTGSQVVR